MKLFVQYNGFNIVLVVFLLSGCNSHNKGNYSVFPLYMQSTENRVFDLYLNYIEEISTPDFPLYLFQSDSLLYSNPDLNQKIITDPNLIFFPATLWQVYLLKEKIAWKKCAINYSEMLGQINTSSDLFDGEIAQNVFLTSYEITKDREYLISLVNILSKQISEFDKTANLKENGSFFKTNDFQLLLENHVFCYASKETGDPVYRKFAVDNSYTIYNEYFKNNTRIASILNEEITTDILNNLTTNDLNILAVGFYGFTILYNETGMVNYLNVSKKIASFFEAIFYPNKSTGASNEYNQLFNKIELFSQSLVSLSFISLQEGSKSTFNETSLIIYKHILDELEQADNSADLAQVKKLHSMESFRLYYYLFEYEIRKQKNT